MLYYKFENYEAFKDLFGIQKHGNGVSSRKNKILLNYIKNKELLHEAVTTGHGELIHISSLTELKNIMKERIKESGKNDETLPYQSLLNGETYYSAIYSTDENNGLCEDGDTKAVRYLNNENGHIYKMKAGKYYRSLILQTTFGKNLPEQVTVCLCEEFAAEWQTYIMGKLPKNKLVVNKDFERIYSSEACAGDFHSCMVDKEVSAFYSESVDADAAYLENEEGKIIARCIIFNKAEDQDGKLWRLAERQYSTGNNEILKRALVDRLLKEKRIDGYKKVGACCGEPRAFIDTEGNSLTDREFTIKCCLDYDDSLSYQDSFKWYSEYRREATNFGKGEIALDITEGSINGETGEYDDYHDYYCEATTLVYFDGREYYCDTDNMSDFVFMEGNDEYHHKDDVWECPVCGEIFVRDYGCSSNMTEERYCGVACMEEDEQIYKEEHWYYSEYDKTYYQEKEEIITYRKWNRQREIHEESTIHTDTLKELLEKEEMYISEGIFYESMAITV